MYNIHIYTRQWNCGSSLVIILFNYYLLPIKLLYLPFEMANQGTVIYLLLGSNVGNRAYYLDHTVELLSDFMEITKISQIYETEAWGDRSQESYLNMAIEAKIDASAVQLHKITRRVEKKLGRVNKGNYQPRTIDIDILFFGGEIIHSKKLIIPHPRIQMRKFVLVPLCELNRQLMHPVFRKNVSELLEKCEDNLEVAHYSREKNQLN